VKFYIYTIPKSGTYLASALLEELGLKNSGWHLMVHHFLDTSANDPDTNAKTPTQTRERGNYVNRLKKLQQGAFCFGHLSPMAFPLPIVRQTAVLRCIREPREVLASEFVDFRFRRSDLGPYSVESVANDQSAFVLYLQRRGPRVRDSFLEFQLYEAMLQQPAYNRLVGHDRQARLAFANLRDPETGLEAVAGAIAKLGLVDNVSTGDMQRALARPTKTHSGDLAETIHREALWTPEAVAIYEALGLDSIYAGIMGPAV